MKRKALFIIMSFWMMLMLAGFAALATGQEQPQTSQPTAKAIQAPEEIFQQIMTTLSAENRARVDSAGQSVNRLPSVPDQANPSRGEEQEAAVRQTGRQQRLEGLPDQLREQVEKAILEMETASQERKAELKGLDRRR